MKENNPPAFTADDIELIAYVIEETIPEEDEAEPRTVASWKHVHALVVVEAKRMRKAEVTSADDCPPSCTGSCVACRRGRR